MAPQALQPTILVVEDDAGVRTLLKRLVDHLHSGWDVLAVENGAEALPVLDTHTVLLVIADYCLPGLNGLQLVQIIKANHPHTHVLVISALGLPELPTRAAAAGADGYLAKPFKFDELSSIIEDLLIVPSGN
jgi:CheY-like chemotaxis protein